MMEVHTCYTGKPCEPCEEWRREKRTASPWWVTHYCANDRPVAHQVPGEASSWTCGDCQQSFRRNVAAPLEPQKVAE